MRKQYKEALPYITKSAQMGNDNAQHLLGIMYAYGYGVKKDTTQAIKWYSMAASKGSMFSQSNLGSVFYGKQDYSSAFSWFNKAAAQGEPYAQYMMGFLYENAIGVSKNQLMAIAWYKKAAVGGDDNAKDRLKELDQDW